MPSQPPSRSRRGRPSLPALALCLILLAPVAAAAAPANGAEAGADGGYIVRFGTLPPGLATGDTFAGGRVLHVDAALGFAVVTSPPLRLLSTGWDANILSIERDVEVRALGQLTAAADPRASEQYGLRQIRAPDAWSMTDGSPTVRLCVVDTGVRHTHEEFAGARWLGGIDFENRDHDAMDDQGHGTHVAGIAAAALGNGAGIAGIAQVGILGVKALDESGGGRASNVASGIRWCADQGAHIITLSLGMPSPMQTMHDAVRYAQAKGSLLVAAAGNDGPCTDCVNYPAAYPEVLAVTCTDAQQRLCSFSSQGPQADLAAPGYGILSTHHAADDAYLHMSGTSMSAPHVSGVAALVWSARPSLSADEVRAILTGTAADLGAPGADAAFGFGRVDAYAAVSAAMNGQAAEPTPAPEPEPAPQPAPEPQPAPAPEPEPDTNAAPIADAGADIRAMDPDGDRRSVIKLDGRASRDTDGTIVSYAWYRYSTLVATGPTAEVELRTGRHPLTLEVTDDKGATARDRVDVEIERNRRPTALFTMRCEGLTCAFDAGASTDPEGSALSFAWDFGDHEPAGARVTHRFDEPGRHRLTLVATDAGGDRDRTSARIFVTPDETRQLFHEGFETGAAGWTASEDAPNLWRVADDCAVAARGGHALAYNRPAPACDRDVGRSYGWVASPLIDLTGATAAALRFDHQRDATDPERSRDTMRVEISDNGGRSWRTLESWRARDDGPRGWHEVTLDLSRYAGERVQVRFSFDARDERGNGGAGWSVDDVRVLTA